MNPAVDLRQLAGTREPATPPPPRRRSDHFWLRYALPVAVLLGLGGVLAWAARDSLLPSREVTVVPVLTSRAEVRQEGAPLFQAAGWVEPRPTPILATALAEGVVEKLLVVEGQEVKAGQPVAQLIEEDARLALTSAEADLQLRKAKVASARATREAAQITVNNPVHLEAALAEAEALLAQKETELAALPFQLSATRARLKQARFVVESNQRAVAALPSVQVQQAETEAEVASAMAAELEAKLSRLKQEVEAHKSKRNALRRRLELKTDEQRALDEGKAQVDEADAGVRQAEAALEAARLRLRRMTVRAPVDGRVLALVARPGMRVMGLNPTVGQDSSTIVSLYHMLQVRADVRLENVSRILPGQKVRIETPAAPGGPIDGEVLFLTSVADIQKDTLQVKVAIPAPPPTLRPEMRVQVTFLAPPVPKAAKVEDAPLRVYVPRQLIETGEAGSRVWIADRAVGVARQRTVKLGASAGELVEVVEGLLPGDRLISGGREGLKDGDRIRVTGEDTSFGVEAHHHGK